MNGAFNRILSQHRGMTLIELLIVVVIVGVIAAIAYPSYRDYALRTNRTDGQIALSRLAGEQEKFRSQCNHYAATLRGAARACGTDPGAVTPYDNGVLYGTGAGTYLSGEDHYAISVTAATAGCPITTCFEMVADPNAAGTTSRQKDNGKLFISSKGEQKWDKKNDDSYTSKWTDK